MPPRWSGAWRRTGRSPARRRRRGSRHRRGGLCSRSRLLWRALLRGGLLFCGLFRRRLRRLLGLFRRFLRRFLAGLLRGFLLCRYNCFLFSLLRFFLLAFSHRGPPVAAEQCLSGVSRRPANRARPIDQFSPGRGPPVAQSRSSIVCTTGTDVPPAICTMHPILPAAIMSGLTIAMLATLRSRSLFAMSGWRMLYVPAEPQHKWL